MYSSLSNTHHRFIHYNSKCVHMSQKHVTARVPEDLYEAIETIQREEQTDRSTAVKRLLQRGVDDWTVEAAVRRYRDGDLSLGAAAEFADLSVWQMLDVLEERNVEVNYTEADLSDDLAAATDR
jgi:predicted HTH domain antitoxin